LVISVSYDLPKELIVLTRASRALAEARTVEEIRDIRNNAEVARHYARTAALGLEIQNFAAEIKLRADRKVGKLLADMKLRGGDRRSNFHDASLKLEEFGISYTQSARWQLEASIPEEVFERYLAEAQQARKELTASDLIRLAKVHASLHKTGHRPKKRPITRHFAQGRAPRSTEKSSPFFEQFSELKNHFSVLSRIIRPLLDDPEVLPRNFERRFALRLVSEIESLLQEVNELLRQDDRRLE